MTDISSSSTEEKQLDIRQIMNMLPHRYPFLMVDRVTKIIPNKTIDAYKCVTINEPFFQGHFPENPVMPGVVIMEALAQTGGLLVLSEMEIEETKKFIFLFSSLDKVKFRRPVYPGDKLDLFCEQVGHKRNLWKMRGVASVNGVVAAEAYLSAVMIPKESI